MYNYEDKLGSFVEENIHIVQPGDTLDDLASRYGVSVEKIVDKNLGLDPNNLQAGQVIDIPFNSYKKNLKYKIKPGDTLYKISRRYNLSIQELIDANPDFEPNTLQLGQIIYIPII